MPRGDGDAGVASSCVISRGGRRLSLSPLLKGGMVMTVANVMTGVLGYAYQVVMGRMLSPKEFALFSAVMALGMFVSAPLGALFMVISRRVAATLAQERLGEAKLLYWKTHRFLFYTGLALLVMLVLFASELQQYLKSPSPVVIWLFGVSVVFGALTQINNAFLQGAGRFFTLGGFGFAGVLVKLALSAALIAGGMGIVGALGGVLISALLVWMAGARVITATLGAQVSSAPTQIEPFDFRSVVPVLVANTAFIGMTQLDMVLVNYYFSSEQAGQYAAASVLGKAVLYLPGGIVYALFPMVAARHAKRESSLHLLGQSVAATFVMCALASLVYWVCGPWLVHLFYGDAYVGAGHLLQWYGLAVLPMALVMVAEYFLIAQGKTLFAWIFLAIAPVQLMAIHFWHDEIWMVLTAIGSCGAAMLVIGYGLMWRGYRRATPHLN